MLHVCSHVISTTYFSILFQKHLLSCLIIITIINNNIFMCFFEGQSN